MALSQGVRLANFDGGKRVSGQSSSFSCDFNSPSLQSLSSLYRLNKSLTQRCDLQGTLSDLEDEQDSPYDSIFGSLSGPATSTRK